MVNGRAFRFDAASRKRPLSWVISTHGVHLPGTAEVPQITDGIAACET